jgi:Trk-type K+ transport system membrane component
VFTAVVALDLTGSYPSDKPLFEVISALSTGGLSMGLTSELIITAMMLIGRVGILAFFVAVVLSTASRKDQAPAAEQDVIL